MYIMQARLHKTTQAHRRSIVTIAFVLAFLFGGAILDRLDKLNTIQAEIKTMRDKINTGVYISLK